MDTLFSGTTDREDFVGQVKVFNDNELFDLAGMEIVLAIRDPSTKANKLTASTANGKITIQGIGVFQYSFTVDEMRGLDSNKTYDIGCTGKINGVTQQIFRGRLPVIEGIVP